jgi:hypothetical protein
MAEPQPAEGNGRIGLLPAEMEMIRGFIKKWWFLIAAATFVAGYIINGLIENAAQTRFTVSLVQWAKEAADAEAKANEAEKRAEAAQEKAALAQKNAEASAKSADVAATRDIDTVAEKTAHRILQSPTLKEELTKGAIKNISDRISIDSKNRLVLKGPLVIDGPLTGSIDINGQLTVHASDPTKNKAIAGLGIDERGGVITVSDNVDGNDTRISLRVVADKNGRLEGQLQVSGERQPGMKDFPTRSLNVTNALKSNF